MNHASEYRIIYKGSFREADFRFELLPYKRKYSSYTRKLIDKAWRAAKVNPSLDIFNGKVVSLISISSEMEDNRYIFRLKVQMTDYKSFYGTNICNAQLLPLEELAYVLAVCAVVETKEGTVYLGLRNLRLAETSGVWHVPGGTFNEVTNPLLLMKRELKEELNIDGTDIQSCICMGFGENLLFRKPEFLCYFHLNISEQHLIHKMQLADDLNEHTEFVFVPIEELDNFMDTHPVAPIGRACVKLYLEYISMRYIHD